MKNFRAFRNFFNVVGGEKDGYYLNLPEHDLGSLSNYLFRLTKKRNIRTCLDVGANIGLSALLISEISPQSEIIAFEPSPRTFGYLENNIRSNFCTAFVSPICSAVGAREGVILFADDQDQSAANHIVSVGTSTGTEVPLTSIDIFAEKHSLANIDFLKIDVEGFETDVLEGAVKVIFKHRPIVFIEYNEYTLKTNAQVDPVTTLDCWLRLLGPLGVVDSLSGATHMLPHTGSEAHTAIRSMMKTNFDVFDLVNFAT